VSATRGQTLKYSLQDSLRQSAASLPKDSIGKRILHSLTKGRTATVASDERLAIPYSLLGVIFGCVVWLAGLTGGLIWTAATVIADVRNLTNMETQRRADDAAYRSMQSQENQATQAYINVQNQKIAKLEAHIEIIERQK
jgi:hypothetical protein